MPLANCALTSHGITVAEVALLMHMHMLTPAAIAMELPPAVHR